MPFSVEGEPGWLAWTFLALVAVLTWAAWATRSAIEAGEELPPPGELFPMVAGQLAVLMAAAVAAAWDAGIDLVPAAAPTVADGLLGLLVLAVMLGSVPILWRFTSAEERRRRAALLPSTRAETLWCLVMSLEAGLVEEVAWRAVLPALLLHYSGSAALAVSASALLFAAAHAVQGRLAMVVVLGVALAFHGLVAATGGLLVAIVVHASYDALVGTWLARRIREREAARAASGQRRSPPEPSP